MSSMLGIHFGHDASAAEVDETGVRQFLSFERVERVKHAMGWDLTRLESLVSAIPQIESVAISSTQNCWMIAKPSKFGELLLQPENPSDDGFSVHKNSFLLAKEIADEQNSEDENCDQLPLYYSWIPKDDQPDWGRAYLVNDLWSQGVNCEVETRIEKSDRSNPNDKMMLRNGFSMKWPYPAILDRFKLSLKVRGITPTPKKGAFFSHHLCHAAYGYYSSAFKKALILSYDGCASEGWAGGGFYYGTERGVIPLLPGGFWIGDFYTRIAHLVGLDGDCGKLMGLAAYGTPSHVGGDFVGTMNDCSKKLRCRADRLGDKLIEYIMKPRDMESLSRWASDKFPNAVVANVAATAQHVFTANVLAAVQRGLSLVELANLNEVDGIVLVGGGALNCPANSAVYECFEVPVHVPPGANDEGLSIGAALLSYVNEWGEFPTRPCAHAQRFLGPSYPEAENVFATQLRSADMTLEELAVSISRGAVVGVYWGESEIGPRALGHRSILADASNPNSCLKVNKLKGRESWRPLAPVCLEEDMAELFCRGPLKSKNMLFTHQAKTKLFPGITHWDHSTRVQCVDENDKAIFALLIEIKKIKGYGVLINTSFNERGNPIVETPNDACEEFKKLGLDYLLTEIGIFKAC
jgi:carbamoyltransferase